MKWVMLCTEKQHTFTRSNSMKSYAFLCFVIVFAVFLCICTNEVNSCTYVALGVLFLQTKVAAGPTLCGDWSCELAVGKYYKTDWS